MQYEVLRLYPAVTFFPRDMTSAGKYRPSSITLSDGHNGSARSIPLKTTNIVFELNIYDVNFHQDTWGDDVYVFRPGRFIFPADGASLQPGRTSRGSSDVSNEQLMFPPTNRFMPWSAGPRICPGMKFAQVCFLSHENLHESIADHVSSGRVRVSLVHVALTG